MARALIESYGILIVRDNAPHDDELFVQTDYDFPGIATAMGWQACSCGETDGTVNCRHRDTTTMIDEAYGYIRDFEGEEFPALDDYFA